jgi:hypothetical protein
MSSRAWKVLAAVTIVAICGGCARATELPSFRCSWKAEPLLRDRGGTLYSDGTLFIQPVLSGRSVFQNEIDERIMGQPEVTLTQTSLKLQFEKPSIAIEEGRHRLIVWIDRFTQQSSISLETWKNSRTPDFEFQWLRMGSCEYTKF